MIDDLNRDIPHPGRRRHQAQWKAQSTPVNTYNAALPANQQISIANGFFYQNGYSIRPDYQSAMVSIYQSTLQRLDFANKPELSTKFINRFESIHWKSVFDPIWNYLKKLFVNFRWVAAKTQEKIQEIISEPLPPYTKAIIASALYFKALWEKSFIDRVTRPYVFIWKNKTLFQKTAYIKFSSSK